MPLLWSSIIEDPFRKVKEGMSLDGPPITVPLWGLLQRRTLTGLYFHLISCPKSQFPTGTHRFIAYILNLLVCLSHVPWLACGTDSWFQFPVWWIFLITMFVVSFGTMKFLTLHLFKYCVSCFIYVWDKWGVWGRSNMYQYLTTVKQYTLSEWCFRKLNTWCTTAVKPNAESSSHLIGEFNTWNTEHVSKLIWRFWWRE
jgi:hypothetical protein